MNNNVKLFLKNYEEMVKAANAIEEFDFEFSVRIISLDSLRGEREDIMRCINKIYRDNGIDYTSDVRDWVLTRALFFLYINSKWREKVICQHL